jgi:hypothetical protein
MLKCMLGFYKQTTITAWIACNAFIREPRRASHRNGSVQVSVDKPSTAHNKRQDKLRIHVTCTPDDFCFAWFEMGLILLDVHKVSMLKVSDNLQAIWLQIKQPVFGLSDDVVLVAVYINPAGGALNQSDIDNLYHALMVEATAITPSFKHVMIAGDFNAHVGTASEFTYEHYALQDRFPCLQTRRLKHPRAVDRPNNAGNSLLEFAESGPFILTTGRGRGDTGQPTYITR